MFGILHYIFNILRYLFGMTSAVICSTWHLHYLFGMTYALFVRHDICIICLEWHLLYLFGIYFICLALHGICIINWHLTFCFIYLASCFIYFISALLLYLSYYFYHIILSHHITLFIPQLIFLKFHNILSLLLFILQLNIKI